ncbi:hypothetical protein AVEN_76547-1 [Araneus ventricosus]|uniref:Uncharacterized protein n=1 Tax=Araneus ventricosus TaxID=182803 RepID=A0A4Y2CGQ9_ARAVE|nr:hypothetical protein AVEN_76547-1 [Araneus ventricosus]
MYSRCPTGGDKYPIKENLGLIELEEKFTHQAVKERPKTFLFRRNGLPESTERFQVVESAELVPGFRREPAEGIFVGIIQADAARQKKSPLLLFHFSLGFQNVDAQQKREEQLKREAR